MLSEVFFVGVPVQCGTVLAVVRIIPPTTILEEIMRDEYSSFDVANALGIPKERLRGWIKEGFVEPTTPAKGRGTKAIFTRTDVYYVGLFQYLLGQGYRREAVSRLVQKVRLSWKRWRIPSIFFLRIYPKDGQRHASSHSEPNSDRVMGFFPENGTFYRSKLANNPHSSLLDEYEEYDPETVIKDKHGEVIDYDSYFDEHGYENAYEKRGKQFERVSWDRPIMAPQDDWDSILIINFKNLCNTMDSELERLE